MPLIEATKLIDASLLVSRSGKSNARIVPARNVQSVNVTTRDVGGGVEDGSVILTGAQRTETVGLATKVTFLIETALQFEFSIIPSLDRYFT